MELSLNKVKHLSECGLFVDNVVDCPDCGDLYYEEDFLCSTCGSEDGEGYIRLDVIIKDLLKIIEETETKSNKKEENVNVEPVSHQVAISTLRAYDSLAKACYSAGGRTPDLSMSLEKFIVIYGRNGVGFCHTKK